MKKNLYPAQALAITMVVLVVSSIIAISIYSRVSKDKALSLDERASAEALQVSDLTLDYLTSKNIGTVLSAIEEEAGQQVTDPTAIPTVTLTETSSNHQLTELIKDKLGVSNADLSSLSICPLSVSANEYFLNVQPADENTFFEIRSGQTFSLPLKGEDFGEDACNISIRSAVRGDSQAGFSVTKIYGKDYVSGIATTYKDYDESDVTNYCFSASDVDCNNTTNFQASDNWVKFSDSNKDAITIDLNETKDGYKLDEVRIQAIGGTIGVSYVSTSGTCANNLQIVKFQAGASCSGTYRGKEILIPLKQWSSPIFNYTLFNGQGNL